jgi:hypothetical protein
MNQFQMPRSSPWLTAGGGRRLMTCVALLGAGMLAGAALAPSDAARAEVKPTGAPQHFLSGDQLSLPILKDIAATLHQMDARIGRIEAIAQQHRGQKTTTSPMK